MGQVSCRHSTGTHCGQVTSNYWEMIFGWSPPTLEDSRSPCPEEDLSIDVSIISQRRDLWLDRASPHTRQEKHPSHRSPFISDHRPFAQTLT